MSFERLRRALVALTLVLGMALPAHAQDVVVFAAASTANALDEIGQMFAAKGLGKVVGSYGASSTLAKQIEQGAPADVFLSADLRWMDELAGHKLIVPGSRRNLLGNTLVLVAPANSPLDRIAIDRTTDLAGLLGDGRLAVGDPDHVPVGLYAKQALENLGQWQALAPKLARADSVRAGLALVERGEVPLGIVYATDAALTPKVKVLGAFPANLHDPILYPVALVAGRDAPAAKAYLDFLGSDEAKSVFAKYGFKLN